MYFKLLIITLFFHYSLVAQIQDQGTENPPQIVMGNLDSKKEIIIYSALSCVACAKLHEDILKKHKKYKIIMRHFPLDSPSLQGAVAVECVRDAALKLKFYEELFKKQDDLIDPNTDLDQFLQKISENLEIVMDKSKKEIVKNSILEEYMKVQDLIDYTPTFFVGQENQPLETRKKSYGALSQEQFDKLLEEDQ